MCQQIVPVWIAGLELQHCIDIRFLSSVSRGVHETRAAQLSARKVDLCIEARVIHSHGSNFVITKYLHRFPKAEK